MDSLLQNQEVRRSVVAVMVLLAVFLLVKSINELKENKFIGKDGTGPSTIVVSGDGEVSITPDIATFSFTVAEESKEIKKAQDATSKKISNILDSLDEFKIAEKDIKTSSYNIYPRYEYYTKQQICTDGWCPPSTGSQVLVGYEVSQTVSVKLRDIDKAGEVLNSLGESGIDNLNGPNFEVENIDEATRQARKMAIDEARAKAKMLARDLGVRLVRIVSFSEGQNYMPYAKYDAVMSAPGGGGREATPEIPRGESEITSSVQIFYEIR